MLSGLTGFTIIGFISVLVAVLILLIGNKIAPKGSDTPGKLASYACGEDITPTKIRVNIENFFIYAVYFMIFDVLGFVLATTLVQPINILIPLAYAAASLVSITILSAKWRK